MIYENLDKANEAVIAKITGAQPFLIDVVPAKTVIKELEGKVLLHAGPPIKWEDMTEPMQGSCYGAAIQFFLNIAMAYCKSVMDAAKSIGEGTIVTAMTRNGNQFAIKVSGLGEQWFTAPVNMPKGLFFTGYTQEDANLDMGDSAITETFGVGGMAMIAAPGVTRFVGADGMGAAMEISDEMEEISVGHNQNLAIPTWDFKGALVGIDVRKVVETGITPLINTGIAHKKAGVGQIGAGTVRAPYDCFTKALEGLVEKYVSEEDN